MVALNFNNLSCQVPDQWIYKHYLKLSQPLDGRRIKLKSIFNTERSASMFLYVKDGKYRWKDFSSGEAGGSPITLLRKKIRLETGEDVSIRFLIKKIKEDYAEWCTKNGSYKNDEIEIEHYLYDSICDFKCRQFTLMDMAYWNFFGIGEIQLKKYNVFPLESFTLGRKYLNGSTKYFSKYSNDYSYGYFSNNQELLKIYNPFDDDFKHITLKKDILGLEQLKNNKPTLIIASSMKDLMTVDALGLNLELVTPISEKVLIPKTDINYFLEIYENVLTMFDNDKTGVKAMMMYKAVYGLDYVYLPYYKDVSEFRNKEDELYVKHELVKAINKKLNKDNIGDRLVQFEIQGFSKNFRDDFINNRAHTRPSDDEEITSRHPI